MAVLATRAAASPPARFRGLLPRVVSAIVLAPLALAAVWYGFPWIDLLAAIPSVVFGLWAFYLLREPLGNTVYPRIASATSHIPILKTLFGTPVNGSSFFTAGLILALMITPIITSISREVFNTVPNTGREFFTSDKARCTSSAVVFPSSTTRRSASV